MLVLLLRETPEDAEAKAEVIADASGEVVGKRLERPTTHSVGKLFQKKLVGQTCIDRATARRSPFS